MSGQCICKGVFQDQYPIDDAQAKLWCAADFSAKLGETLILAGTNVPTLFVGLGPRERATTSVVRSAGAAAGRRLRHLDKVICDLGEVDIPALPTESIRQAAAEGVHLGSYTFVARKSIKTITTKWVPTQDSVGWELGVAIARAVLAARDLVNEPANILTPSHFADRCKALATSSELSVAVIEESELRTSNLGGILAAGKGSVEPPLLIRIEHEGVGDKLHLCLVGKGVTFDSGGLSLKDPDAMMGMKQDMAGAAAIIAAMSLLDRVAPKLHVVAFLPMVENMPGPHSTRPGDVVTMRTGKTVEILNIDFEGRLILGDALALAAEACPSAIVDLATLTGAAIHALGERTAALFGNDRELVTLVSDAAIMSGERAWQMPLPDYLHYQITSTVADIKNFPMASTARSSTAALFLQEFIPDEQPWVHLDIAGPAWADEEYDVTTAGGTGFGVRLLVELFYSLSRRF